MLLAALRLRRAGARRRYRRRRPLRRPRRRDPVQRGSGGLGLRPWQRLRGRAEPGRHQRPCRRHGAGGEGSGDRRHPLAGRPGHPRPHRRDRSGARPRLARDRARQPDADPALHRPARRRRAGRRIGLSRQCRSRHRAFGPGLYHAAAADPLDRHLLQRPPDQRHHHPPPHRQYRPRPFGRAVARPVRPGARRQHA